MSDGAVRPPRESSLSLQLDIEATADVDRAGCAPKRLQRPHDQALYCAKAFGAAGTAVAPAVFACGGLTAVVEERRLGADPGMLRFL
ncbi:hypothetical protein NDU88_003915 [Pleurodeles waltl]|uniref:Uncharacterized protein n=1 Tax=Pleurodeles waltl TaxID=8319 RepID=A0AAV7TSG7_PLEWA|nr:hypothetical protein NDU88_003915 [Pleurodeles waltl]